MSVCLVVTKSVATAALGIYTGMVVTRNLVLSPTEFLTSVGRSVFPDDRQSTWDRLFNRFTILNGSLAFLSTAFFGLAYFGSPNHWRHPYLLYCFIGIPFSWGLDAIGNGVIDIGSDESTEELKGGPHSPLDMQKNARAKISRQFGNITDYEEGSPNVSDDHDDIISEDSIIDLGRHEDDVHMMVPMQMPEVNSVSTGVATSKEEINLNEVTTPSPRLKIARHVATAFSVVIFIANVIGCLGEVL